MTEFKVKWEIEVEANSLNEAAQVAREIQLDPTSIATVFEVLQQQKLGEHTLNIQRGVIDTNPPFDSLSHILRCPDCGYRRLAIKPSPVKSPGNTDCICLYCGKKFYVGVP